MINIENFETNKNNFFELYEKFKKGEVDSDSISTETLKKICVLLEEEIKIVKKDIEIKKAELNAF